MIPFLKWVGGKGRLIGDLHAVMQYCKGTRLVEPFVGAGSVFMAYHEYYDSFRLNDSNPDLIQCYETIRDHFEEFFTLYEKLVSAYWFTAGKERMYYRLREAYNQRTLSPIERAASTIVLNKTCYNGLYRVNRKGEFNVAWGKRENPSFSGRANLESISTLLQKAEFSCGDFADVQLQEGDVLYLDPPYQPRDNNFTSYTATGFDFFDQLRVAAYAKAADEKGIPFVLSNSNFHEIKAWFPQEWRRHVSISRCMAPDPDDRLDATEIIVSNRWPS